MIKTVIYGAGGFGRETALMIEQINALNPTYQLIGFCDDNLAKHKSVDGLPIIGGKNELNNFGEPLAVSLAIADPAIRKHIRQAITNPQIIFPTLVHPSVVCGNQMRNRFEEGVIIGAGCIITTHVYIQQFSIINLSCTIGHDVVIKEYCSIMPACSLSGHVTLEESVFLGTGAKILPGLTVGAGAKIGAGAVVTRSISSGVTAVGVPARPISDDPGKLI
jgi:sugar O-acyltransferase (sialic acid O-acetyltransferase NeuD family)